MKEREVRKLLFKAGYQLPFEPQLYYSVNGVKASSWLRVYMTPDGDMYVGTVDYSQRRPLSMLRFRFPEAGGHSPCTWNALRLLAFSIWLKDNPKEKVRLYDQPKQIRRFLLCKNEFVDFRGGEFSRTHDDCDERGEEKLKMHFAPDHVLIRADRLSVDWDYTLLVNKPKYDESQVVWNALVLLAHAIELDCIEIGRTNIFT